MENKKLTISIKRYQGNSGVVSIRLPEELIKELDNIAKKTGRTRNDIVQKCIEFSLENLEIKE